MRTSPEPGAGAAADYHEGARHWQDRFDTRRLADRLAEQLSRSELNDEDGRFVERQPLFFLATADDRGQHPRVGLLFIDFEQPQRLRVLGRATADADDALRD